MIELDEKNKEDEVVALLKLLTLSEKDSKNGNVYSREQLLDNLRSERFTQY